MFITFTENTEASETLSRSLADVHAEQVRIEQKIAETKPICLLLEDLREERTRLTEEATSLINQEVPK
jgi:hypothetical protein